MDIFRGETLFAAFEAAFNNRMTVRAGSGDTERRLGLLNVARRNNYDVFHFYFADKAIPPGTWVNYSSGKVRTELKSSDEGGAYSGHLITTSGADGKLYFCLELVHGINTSSFRNFTTKALKEYPIKSTYRPSNQKGHRDADRDVRAVADILGRESATIREALEKGVFQDIEYRAEVTKESRGLEVPEATEVIDTRRWDIDKKTTVERAQEIVAAVFGFGSSSEKSRQVFVRIGSADGRTSKRAEVLNTTDPFSQPFIQREKIGSLSRALPQFDSSINDELVNRMLRKIEG